MTQPPSIAPQTVPNAQQRARGRKAAEWLERSVATDPQHRRELLLDAAAEWIRAGDAPRALRLYDDLIATESSEGAQWAMAEKSAALLEVGAEAEAAQEMARLRSTAVFPGPAGLLAHALEGFGRLDDALTWFNIACRDLLALVDEEEIAAAASTHTMELVGRARVREKLGLPVDSIDEHGIRVKEDFKAGLKREFDDDANTPAAAESRAPACFFPRAEIARALGEGLVPTGHAAGEDTDPYYRALELGWRRAREEHGLAGMRILAVSVDEVLAYAAERKLDPRAPQTQADHLMDRLEAGRETLMWPPERNAPCWCGTGRKYKKCCGRPENL